MVTALSSPAAPLFGTPLVDGLHPLDFRQIIVAQNSLTSFQRGVDSLSFFDISAFFQLVASPGAKQGHQSNSASC